jgi:hypothetical protein
LSLADRIRLMTTAARWPARRKPAKSQLDLPRATGLIPVFDMVVVDGQIAVLQIPQQGCPTSHTIEKDILDLLAEAHDLKRQPNASEIGGVLGKRAAQVQIAFGAYCVTVAFRLPLAASPRRDAPFG